MGVVSSVKFVWEGDNSSAVARMAELSAEERRLTKAVKDAGKALDEAKAAAKDTTQEFERLGKASKALTEWQAKFSAESRTAKTSLKELGQESAKTAKDLEAMYQAAEKHGKSYMATRSAMQLGGKQLASAAEEAAKATGGLSDQGRKLTQVFQQAAFGIDDASQSLSMGRGLSGALIGAGNNITAMASAFGALPTVIAAATVSLGIYFARASERAKESTADIERQTAAIRELAAGAEAAKEGKEESQDRGQRRVSAEALAGMRQRAQEAEERVANMRRGGGMPYAMTNEEIRRQQETQAAYGGFGRAFTALPYREISAAIRQPLAGLDLMEGPRRQRLNLESEARRLRAEVSEAERDRGVREPNQEAERQFGRMRDQIEPVAQSMTRRGASAGMTEAAITSRLGEQFPELREAFAGLVRDMVAQTRREVLGERAGPAMASIDPVTATRRNLERRVQSAQDYAEEISEQNRIAQRARGGRPLRPSEERTQRVAEGVASEQQDLLRQFERTERRIREGDDTAHADMNRLIEEIRRLPTMQSVVGTPGHRRAPGGAAAPAPGGGLAPAAPGGGAVPAPPAGGAPPIPPPGGNAFIAPPMGPMGALMAAMVGQAPGAQAFAPGPGNRPATSAHRRAANRAAYVAHQQQNRVRFLQGRRDPNAIEGERRQRSIANRLARETATADRDFAEPNRVDDRIERTREQLGAARESGDTARIHMLERQMQRQTELLERITASNEAIATSNSAMASNEGAPSGGGGRSRPNRINNADARA